MTRAAGQPSVVIGFRLAGLAPQIAIITLGHTLSDGAEHLTEQDRNGRVLEEEGRLATVLPAKAPFCDRHHSLEQAPGRY